MIRSEHMKSCLTAQIRFMLFKGPGPFKKFFKIGGNVEELQAYRLIPLTPPLFFHFTLPLNFIYIKINIFSIESTIINASKGGKPDRKPYRPMVSVIHTKQQIN